jgi:anti-sigma B factor antagonist
LNRRIDVDPNLEGESAGFAWSTRREDGVLTIALKGELDLAAVPEFEDAIAETFAGREPLIVLDLGELEFIDSMGLRLLLGIRGAVGERAGRLLLARAPHPVLKLLQITGLVDWFEYVEGAPPGETLCPACGGWVPVESQRCGNCDAAM